MNYGERGIPIHHINVCLSIIYKKAIRHIPPNVPPRMRRLRRFDDVAFEPLFAGFSQLPCGGAISACAAGQGAPSPSMPRLLPVICRHTVRRRRHVLLKGGGSAAHAVESSRCFTRSLNFAKLAKTGNWISCPGVGHRKGCNPFHGCAVGGETCLFRRSRPGRAHCAYSFDFNLDSFSRRNASISAALARTRSHCSL